jgi:hypothetical protein
MLILPVVTAIDAVRTAHTRDTTGMVGRMAVVAFGLLVPMGILLPIWLAFGTSEAGESSILVAMLLSVCGVLLGITLLTFTLQPHLPFALLDYLIVGGSESAKADKLFAAMAVLLPTTFLLPVYFQASLSEAGELVTLVFLGLSTVLFAAMFGRSIRERALMGQNGVSSLIKARPTSMVAKAE